MLGDPLSQHLESPRVIPDIAEQCGQVTGREFDQLSREFRHARIDGVRERDDLAWPDGDPVEERLAVPRRHRLSARERPRLAARATVVPLPRRLSTRPRARSSSYAATTVERLTARASARRRSAGRRAPTGSSAEPISAAIASASRRYRPPPRPVSRRADQVRQDGGISRTVHFSSYWLGWTASRAARLVQQQSSSRGRESTWGSRSLGIRRTTVVLVGMPGPNNLYISLRSLTQGRRAGVVSALAIETGTLVYIVVTALGLATLVQASPVLFTATTLTGALYLAVPGIKTLTAPADRINRASRPHRSAESSATASR